MARRLRRSVAPVTTALLVLNALIWLGQISPWGYLFTNSMFYAPLFTPWEPWRMITAGFVHDWTGPLHILLNSYAIYIFGRQLEPMLGGLRYLALYIVSIFGGSVAVLWLSAPNVPVVGASGAFFGLMGAYFVVIRSLGGNAVQLLVLIAINLSLGFFVPGISWEGHLGGLVTGAAVAGIYTDTRKPNQRAAQFIGVVVLVILLIALSWWRVQQIYS
jgi:membrane associated rhomboid family serine protease